MIRSGYSQDHCRGMEGYIRKINRHKKESLGSIEMFGRSVDMEVGLEIVKKYEKKKEKLRKAYV